MNMRPRHRSRRDAHNSTFLNYPRPVVFDAPIHPKYRLLTQEWLMPRYLRRIEDEPRMLMLTQQLFGGQMPTCRERV